ncbi:MAG TPA: hypothetical protein DEP88_10900 [Verrucomicrobiales bacterium]|jgi:lipoprotein-anchoring transpeptidase ErfK/SrfK|nr:hypothetical protein [Verrucomicrobiales bacterium]HCI91737.1 hypothetical protein [Verrucomicrobiales bacterium]
MKLLISFIPVILASALCSSCGNPGTPNPDQKKPLKALYQNPHKPGTYDYFRAQKGYPRNYGIWKNNAILRKTNPSNASIHIDLSEQRGYLMNGTDLAMDYPISSGRSKYPTPTGNFQILEMTREDKRSTSYGKIYDADGELVNADADSRKDPIPEGGEYIGAPMPYWMRISWDGVGMHRGKVPRYPASHGCIRTHSRAVSIVFEKTRIGTRVSVVR